MYNMNPGRLRLRITKWKSDGQSLPALSFVFLRTAEGGRRRRMKKMIVAIVAICAVAGIAISTVSVMGLE